MKKKLLLIAYSILILLFTGCPSPIETPVIYSVTYNGSNAIGSDAVSTNVNSAIEGTLITLTATLETDRLVVNNGENIRTPFPELYHRC